MSGNCQSAQRISRAQRSIVCLPSSNGPGGSRCMEVEMTAHRLLFVIVSLVLTAPLPAHADPWWWSSDSVEPTAGSWKTWVIDSGASQRVAPPPRIADTRAEVRALRALILQNDAQTRQQITYWDAGSPGYRWIDLINTRYTAGTLTTPFPHRVCQVRRSSAQSSFIAADPAAVSRNWLLSLRPWRTRAAALRRGTAQRSACRSAVRRC